MPHALTNPELEFSCGRGMAYTPRAIWKALRSSGKELRRDENELTFIMDRL